MAVAGYIMKQRLKGRRRYPLVLMLEPLFRCNLACAGCGKIDYPEPILNRRLSVQDCLDAVDECGAPMVAIPGGEPLIHKEIGEIVAGIVARRKYVSLCTNALLLEKKLDLFTPSPYLFFSVHLDGLREEHDKSVCQTGVFDKAVKGIKAAKDRGFAVNVNATILTTPYARRSVSQSFSTSATEIWVSKASPISPGYAYERAPDQDPLPDPSAIPRNLFRDDLSACGKGKKWKFSQSTLVSSTFLGRQPDLHAATPWSNADPQHLRLAAARATC